MGADTDWVTSGIEALTALRSDSYDLVLMDLCLPRMDGVTATRMIRQGAVKIDRERVEDPKLEIKAGTTHVYQVGKRRFARVTLT